MNTCSAGFFFICPLICPLFGQNVPAAETRQRAQGKPCFRARDVFAVIERQVALNSAMREAEGRRVVLALGTGI